MSNNHIGAQRCGAVALEGERNNMNCAAGFQLMPAADSLADFMQSLLR